ncbi:ADP-ribosylglycohydrolase family protein [Candidatus Uabimicrobium sp. HlEnr_7]|uniref:ADP-ribosylglycohydrolase family protein n=1 Tax=Candidatus Uabimicrobium helgolandensis TaxID=3095367 RepID=UPI0035589506
MLNKYTGGLLGCAVGDALGAPYEGLWSESIPEKQNFFCEYAIFEGYEKGQYTDDTQLTIATLQSIVAHKEISVYLVAESMFSLWKTQVVIGPGGACTQSADRFLSNNDPLNCGAVKGNAGNGTAMRTAMLGLAFCDSPTKLPQEVAQISKLTHKDSRSIAGGIAIAKAAQLIATEEVNIPYFCKEIAKTIYPYNEEFAKYIDVLPLYINREDEETFAFIAWSGMERPEFATPIITPFVIPTVLASLWSFLRYKDSWKDAVYGAIKMGGDVDTLGAITGALSGIYLGESAIPSHLLKNVCSYDYLRDLACKYYYMSKVLL